MKIEKKKVTHKAPLSTAAKTAIATALGMSATFSLNACTGNAESGSVIGPVENPESSGDTEGQQSSSSVLDIPKSQEALSSSALEALSSAVEKLSSSSYEPPMEAGVIVAPPEDSPSNSSSSTETAPASSTTSSSDVAPASSSVETPASSSSAIKQSSSSVKTIIEPIPVDTMPMHRDPTPIHRDTMEYRVHLCPDGTSNCMMVSMVTTFEHDDFQA